VSSEVENALKPGNEAGERVRANPHAIPLRTAPQQLPPPPALPLSLQLRSIVLVNCGAVAKLAELLTLPAHTRCYVLDCHRPFHHTNLRDARNVRGGGGRGGAGWRACTHVACHCAADRVPGYGGAGHQRGAGGESAEGGGGGRC
jgi:hypothetical protein